MDLAKLARAAADQTISLAELLQLVREARRESDSWTREFATTAFIRRCSDASLSEWEQVKHELQGGVLEDEYLLKIGTLGHLSMNFSNPNRECERAEIIRWLVRTDPADPCLGYPHAYGVDDEWYQAIKPEWLANVNEHSDDIRVLSNAARFFFRRDKELAEEMYSKCVGLEPENDFWKERINKLREFHAPRTD